MCSYSKLNIIQVFADPVTNVPLENAKPLMYNDYYTCVTSFSNVNHWNLMPHYVNHRYRYDITGVHSTHNHKYY